VSLALARAQATSQKIGEGGICWARPGCHRCRGQQRLRRGEKELPVLTQTSTIGRAAVDQTAGRQAEEDGGRWFSTAMLQCRIVCRLEGRQAAG
jgi:hypothetical protein